MPDFSIEITSLQQTVHELALYSDGDGVPEFARFTVPNLPSEELPDSVTGLIQAVREHLLSVLRLSYKQEATIVDFSVHTFSSPERERDLNFRFRWTGERTYRPDEIKSGFVHSFHIRELIRLYVDGIDDRIPLEYRFLSLYKLVESRFRHLRQWEHTSLLAALAPYQAAFRDAGFAGTPFATLQDLRDRCAHIKTGKDVWGVTHLNHTEASKVSRVLPILRAVAAGVLNERADGKFLFPTEVIPMGFVPNGPAAPLPAGQADI